MTAFLGFAIVIILIVLIMRERACAPVIFGVLPVIAALILGYAMPDIVTMYLSGFQGAVKNAVLAIFAVMYFFLMNEVGAFDPIVDFIVKKSKGSTIAVFIAAALISIVTTLDGQSASTIVVTVPAMYPIFKKLKIRPVNLAFIITLIVGTFMYMPYTSAMMAVSTALEISAQDVWKSMIPVFAIGLILDFIVIIFMAKREEKRIKDGKNDYLLEQAEEEAAAAKTELTSWNKKMFPVNWLITIIVMYCLLTNKINSAFLFVFVFSIAVVLNYPNARQQSAVIKKAAPMAMYVALVFLMAGGYSKVMSETGMMNSMVTAILNGTPAALTRYLHIILGCLSVPLSFFLGADTFYFGLVPIAGNISASYGITAVGFCISLMIGKGLAMLCSPTTPNLYLLTDMCHVSTKDYFKYTFFIIWIMSFVLLAVSTILRIVPL